MPVRTNISGGSGLEVKGNLAGYTVTTSGYTTKISKTGKGVLLLIHAYAGMQPEIWVDGVKKLNATYPMSASIPFNTSLEIKTNNTSGFFAIFAMGSNNLKECTPSIVRYNNSAVSSGTTLRQNITGKGMLICAFLNAINVKIVIDGTTVYDSSAGTYDFQGVNLRFNSSLQFYADGALGNAVQLIYLLD